MALLVIVPSILLTVISGIIAVNQGKASADEVNVAQASLVEQILETTYAKNIYALRAFASSPDTVDYLEGTISGEEVETKILNQMLQIDSSLDDGNNTALSGADGQQVLRTKGKLVNVAEREYFTVPMGGADFYVSDLIISKSTGTAIATFSVPIIGTSGKPIGIVQRNFDTGVLHEILANEITQDRQEIVVVDRTGTVVAHSAREVNVEDPEKQDQNPFYTDSQAGKTEGDYIAPFAGDTWIISWEKIPSSDWVVASCRVQEVALQSVYKTVFSQIAFGIVFIIVGIVVALLFSKSITKPLNVVGQSLSGLSDGRFVEIDQYTERSDEFGEMIRNTNSVIDKLRDIVGTIRTTATDLEQDASGLANSVTQITGTMDNVSSAINEIANGATQQADEIQNATEHIGVISGNIDDVTTNAENLSNAAEEMKKNSQESEAELQGLRKSSDEMAKAISRITDAINATNVSVDTISQKVEAIDSIASQTSLLALNASIEAARAGEAGRGFAVVAEEIGKLATDSAGSANEIREEMEKLLSQSKEAVGLADEVAKSNKAQQETIEGTVTNIQSLIDGIAVTVSGVASIGDNAKACDRSKLVVTDAMHNLSAISEENAASTQETSASMEQVNETMKAIADEASFLKENADNLGEKMSFFKD